MDAFQQDCDALAQAHQGLGDYPYLAEAEMVQATLARMAEKAAHRQSRENGG